MKSETGIVVVGAGISGLTCALRLLQRGHRVEIVADRRQPRTTSNVAAGLWYPYKAGGSRVAGWALASLDAYRELAAIDQSGVRFVSCMSDVPATDPTPFWANHDVGYEAFTDRDKPSTRTIRARLPVAEPGLLLPWLEREIIRLDGAFNVRKLPLRSLSTLDFRWIVNCSGLGARHLCSDESVEPIRGVVVRVARTGIDACLTDDIDPDRPTYIVPNSDCCVLGGSAVAGRWDTHVSDLEVNDILERCARLDRRVLEGRVVGAIAGLRPGRPEVRLEFEEIEGGKAVVHNYGHGGSGFTLAWGCADDVADIVDQATG